MSATGDDSPSIDGTPHNKLSSLHAPKNKQCPFCGESFTSSSLGRHLDLYIKEKNPKAADGIHNVDRIRQIRGTITRRQPKRNVKGTASPSTDVRVGRTDSVSLLRTTISPDDHENHERGIKWTMNKPTWEATGVITETSSIPGLNNHTNHDQRNRVVKSAAAKEARILQAEKIRAKAAELALQELLDSVNAARTQADLSTPFDFDFLSQTFPALCLKMLPRQPTLHAAQVIEDPGCCPIGPPGQEQYNVLHELIESRLKKIALLAQADQRNGSVTSTVSDLVDEAAAANDFDAGQYTSHLERAWEVWSSISETQKAALWHLEVLRGLSHYQDEQQRLSEALLKARAEVAHLRTQIERLNECQQPKEFTFQIPTNWHIPKDTALSLVSNQPEPLPTRDVLIEKWTNVIKKDVKFPRPLSSPGGNLDEMDIDVDGEEEDSEDAAGEEDENHQSMNGY